MESALYQATKHLRVITGADLAAVVAGQTVEPDSAERMDVVFPVPGTTGGLFD